MRASSCNTHDMTCSPSHSSTILQQLWELPAGEDNRCCCARYRSSREMGFLEAQDIYHLHHHSAETWSKFSQQLNARSLHPGFFFFFPGISSIRLEHQHFCSSKAWTPAMLARSLEQCRRQKNPWQVPRTSGYYLYIIIYIYKGRDYHRYQNRYPGW